MIFILLHFYHIIAYIYSLWQKHKTLRVILLEIQRDYSSELQTLKEKASGLIHIGWLFKSICQS